MAPLSVNRLGPLLVLLVIATSATLIIGSMSISMPRVIELTHLPCQFLEPEGVDHGYSAATFEDCVTIAAATNYEREADADVLELVAGRYTFRVTNESVPYAVGFWVRESGFDPANDVHSLTRTSLVGDGVGVGQSRDFSVELMTGEYLYSDPLNATPEYRIFVR